MIDLSQIDKSKKYDILFINYEMENGIKILNNLEELEQFSAFYKIYIFNEEEMFEYIDNDIKVKNYIKKEKVEVLYTEKIYIEEKFSNKKLYVTHIKDENGNRNFYYSGIRED